MKTNKYHGIRVDDPEARCGLRNPDRGWRLETVIAEPAGTTKDAAIHSHADYLSDRVTPGYNDHWWTLAAERYKPFGLTLAQTYCYLDEFVGKSVSDDKLELFNTSMKRLRRRGLKTLLRFAYEKGSGCSNGPTVDDILNHLEQLKPVIHENTDVLYAMQAGLVGAWGEWHSSMHGIEKDHGALAAIVAKVLDVLPENRMIQVRVPKYKRWVLESPVMNDFHVIDAGTAHSGEAFARIGFHNDGFLANKSCGSTWSEPPHYSNPGNPEFDYMTAESPYVPVDGELFWRDRDRQVDGLEAAVRMRLHHYTSFSLWHSYSGREGDRFSIDEWIRRPVTASQVEDSDLPADNDYFIDSAGAEAVRSQFDYITDHLGYRIELQQAKFEENPKRGGMLDVDVDLINRGFAAMVNPRPVYLVIVTFDGEVHAFPVPEADPMTWQPFDPTTPGYAPLTHRLSAGIPVPENLSPGGHQIGLWMPDGSESIRLDPEYAVRVANRDVPWWVDDNGNYGVNIMGVINVR